MDVLNILLELEQIAVQASHFVVQCKTKEGMDAYVGSSLARKFRSLNANIVSNWGKKLQYKSKVVSESMAKMSFAKSQVKIKTFFSTARGYHVLTFK